MGGQPQGSWLSGLCIYPPHRPHCFFPKRILDAGELGPASLSPNTSQGVGPAEAVTLGKGGPAVAPDNSLQLVEDVRFLVFLPRLWPVQGILRLPTWGTQGRAHQLRTSLTVVRSVLQGLLPPAYPQGCSSGRIGFQTCPGWGLGLGRAACGRAPAARGFHIRFGLLGILASMGFYPSRADSRFRGHGQPVQLVRALSSECLCVVSTQTCLLSARACAGVSPRGTRRPFAGPRRARVSPFAPLCHFSSP